MNITLMLIGFSLAVLMGAGLASLFATVKPDWSDKRRRLTAAAILPTITALATLLGILLISTGEHRKSGEMENIVIVGGGRIIKK